MSRHGRSRLARQDAYAEMEEHVSGEAARNFHRQAYAVGAPGIREETVAEYLTRKCKSKKERGAGGQVNSD